MTERNVVGGELEPCSTDPLTGFYRDGNCNCGLDDVGLHAVCAVMTAEFLQHQREVGNDLTTPRPEYQFPGLQPGDPQPAPDPEPPPAPARHRAWSCSSGEKLARAELKRVRLKNKRQAERITTQAK